MKFDAETIGGVVQHMNADHSDACLAIAQAYSAMIDIERAELTGLTPTAVQLNIYLNSAKKEPKPVEISFELPLNDASEIRSAVVGLTKTARHILASRLDEDQTED